MNDEKIKNKILNNQKLTEEEIKYIVWKWNTEDSIEEEHHRWWAPITLIFKIKNEYYSIRYKEGLTELQENEYPTQKAIQVRKKPITAYIWEKIK